MNISNRIYRLQYQARLVRNRYRATSLRGEHTRNDAELEAIGVELDGYYEKLVWIDYVIAALERQQDAEFEDAFEASLESKHDAYYGGA